jgi:CheY-like chemotaxis protein
MQQVADITFRGTEFKYVGARSYDEGLDKAKSQKPDLVLADSQMPGKTGYDLCLALKNDPKTADVPVVILVGNGAAYDSARGTQVGADANLPKPWDTQTMLEKVTEIVGKGATAKPGAAAPTPTPIAAAAKSSPAAIAAQAAAAQPPRSATIMGMPTIKMPAGVATPVATTPAPPANKTTAMAVPPIAPTPAATTPGPNPALRPPANVAAPASTTSNGPSAMPASTIGSIGAVSRVPMIGGTPTKRSVLVERTLAKMAARLAEAAGIEPGSPELLALLKLSSEVVERIVWEVVPDLAEQIIRENLATLAAQKRS